MPEEQVISKDVVLNKHNHPRFVGALLLGSFVGLFMGLIMMALAILICGVLRLFLPDSTFQVAGMAVTAVIFVVFFALGWAGGTLVIWHKLPQFSSDK
ncbi:MAG: hypothetical protein IAF02_03170 [Anaerolineae bacterium]|nr:hypothetical protein [Anaerolineae bacterium]